ncbi:hypothetical protein QOZ80_2AG0116970 [Eleusine coracana subsp. coracana]|nr:hypothetical protein QOZ80_2AG0116970 [Eleusine coracana subsp. coracana]
MLRPRWLRPAHNPRCNRWQGTHVIIADIRRRDWRWPRPSRRTLTPSSRRLPRVSPLRRSIIPAAAAGRPERKLCIIDRSDTIDRAELELRRGLCVTIIGARPEVSAGQVLVETALVFNLDVGTLQIMTAAPEDLSLLLTDEETAIHVLNGGRPLHGPTFSVQFKRWSRLANATGTELPVLVDVELQGIPAHAWDRATAAQILGESCWIRSVHPDTVARRDLTSFKVTA